MVNTEVQQSKISGAYNNIQAYKTTIKSNGLSDPFCAISHMVGAVFSIVALVLLLVLSHGKAVYIVSFSVYGSSLILLYTASTLHHSIGKSNYLQRLDHAMIYALIAGSYTPLCLIILHGAWGWSILGVEYGLALIGIVTSLSMKRVPDYIRMIIYILMGWLITIALNHMQHLLPHGASAWLIAGGVTYTVGAVVFATNWPHICPGKFHAHDLWHLFVLGGSICHFMMMLTFVL